MSKLQLNEIAAKALQYDKFRVAILYGRRREPLKDFALTKDELEAVLRIDETDLDQFIIQLGRVISGSNVLI